MFFVISRRGGKKKLEDSSKLGGGFEFVLDESLVLTVSRYLKVASTLFDVPFFFFLIRTNR